MGGSLGQPAGKILHCQPNWEDEIDAFWTAMRVVFHTPERSLKCLKILSYGIAIYQPLVSKLLMKARVNNEYWIAQLIKSANNTTQLRNIVQSDRYVLYNFGNTLPRMSDTLE
ncbi:hypothetical protein EDB80DRAFT_879239 [Ilyonectria destructans]|nr:hypothetical protein EDB80DRAFT_879239 [Ilyonectria destructans]